MAGFQRFRKSEISSKNFCGPRLISLSVESISQKMQRVKSEKEKHKKNRSGSAVPVTWHRRNPRGLLFCFFLKDEELSEKANFGDFFDP